MSTRQPAAPKLKVTLIIAEAALELVPQKIASRSACRNSAQRLRKRPTDMILDGSIHHSAMGKLQDKDKRGRPDIVHFCLLEALGSPLNLDGRLDTWVHTYDDHVLHFDPGVKLPRNQDRFKGVIEKLYHDGILSNNLITLEDDLTLTELLDRLGCHPVICCARDGEQSLQQIVGEEGGTVEDGTVEGGTVEGGSEEDGTVGNGTGDSGTEGDMGGIAVLVGGFAHGEFTEEAVAAMTHRASLYDGDLDTWVVVSRALAFFEGRS